jgi:hypothetical protein
MQLQQRMAVAPAGATSAKLTAKQTGQSLAAQEQEQSKQLAGHSSTMLFTAVYTVLALGSRCRSWSIRQCGAPAAATAVECTLKSAPIAWHMNMQQRCSHNPVLWYVWLLSLPWSVLGCAGSHVLQRHSPAASARARYCHWPTTTATLVMIQAAHMLPLTNSLPLHLTHLNLCTHNRRVLPVQGSRASRLCHVCLFPEGPAGWCQLTAAGQPDGARKQQQQG